MTPTARPYPLVPSKSSQSRFFSTPLGLKVTLKSRRLLTCVIPSFETAPARILACLACAVPAPFQPGNFPSWPLFPSLLCLPCLSDKPLLKDVYFTWWAPSVAVPRKVMLLTALALGELSLFGSQQYQGKGGLSGMVRG